MNSRPYNPDDLAVEETPFKEYFDRLAFEFGNGYEIWVQNDDFYRMIAGCVVHPLLEVVVIIYFRYGSTK